MANNDGRRGYEGYGQPDPEGYGQYAQPAQRTQRVQGAQGSQRVQSAQRPQNVQAQQRPQQYMPQGAPAAGGYVPVSPASGQNRRQGPGANPYAQYARGSAGYSSAKRPGMSRGKKVAIAVVIIVVIAAAVAGGAYAFTQIRKAEVNADLHSMDKDVLEAIDEQLTGTTSFTDPFTVLLLGSDERTDDDEAYDVGGARTDTIILVRVDPMNKEASMVSIPRDTMVELPGVGIAKINAAYYYGGAPSTIAAVKDLTGVDIDHFALVNFGGLVDLVNAIGGIDVYVDERVDNPKAGNVVVEAGQQHLDGEHALTLARDRDYADGDYTRVQNQRKVIMGIIERVMNAPSSDLAGLIQASTGFVQTDSGITFDWILSLAQQMRHVENNHDLVVVSTTLPSTPAYINEVSYVIADKAATAELMQIFLSGGDISQPLTQSSISADVANAGGSYGGGSSVVNGGEETYYEEPTEYYAEEPAAEAAAPAEEAPAGDSGGNAGGGSDGGSGE